jgi:hypothetical protein
VPDRTAARRPQGQPGLLEIRAGVHTGECELLVDDDVGGLEVHIGARVSALAAPGEVLASSTVRDLIVGSGQILTDRGERDLKGVSGPCDERSPSGTYAERLAELSSIVERLVRVMRPTYVPVSMRKPVPLLDDDKPLDVIAAGDYRRVSRIVAGLESSGAA